jgi:hypothetical protein
VERRAADGGRAHRLDRLRAQQGRPHRRALRLHLPASGRRHAGHHLGHHAVHVRLGHLRAGLHAGRVSADGGVVTIEVLPGAMSYVGSTQNGLTSSSFGSYASSYLVVP